MTVVEPWETLTHRSPLREVAGRSPFHPLAQRDLTARGTAVLGCAAVGGFAALDVALAHDLGFTFGVFFVLVCVTAALAADHGALFAPAVMPPLLMLAVVAAVSIVAPGAVHVHGLADSAGALQRTIAGVIDHATALVVAHVGALAVVALRVWSELRVRRRP